MDQKEFMEFQSKDWDMAKSLKELFEEVDLNEIKFMINNKEGAWITLYLPIEKYYIGITYTNEGFIPDNYLTIGTEYIDKYAYRDRIEKIMDLCYKIY